MKLKERYLISVIVSVLIFLSTSSVLISQQIIENPKLPFGVDTRMTVQLVEVMRYSDEDKNFILRGPINLRLDSEGNIYCDDYSRILALNQNGNHIFTLFEKRGLGPGEINTRPEFVVLEDFIFVHVNKPPKVMYYSKDATLMQEKKHDMTSRCTLIGATNSHIFFIEEDLSYSYGKKGYIDFPVNLYKASLKFDTVQIIHTYPRKHYRFGMGGWQWSNLNHLLYDNKYIFITHTEEYKIMRFNLIDERVDLVFNRKYERVKRPPSPPKEKRPGFIYPPEHKYLYDTTLLLNVNGRIWVLTSTKDENSNRLVDVFSSEGKYLDSFFLKFPNMNKLLRVYRGSFVYANGFFYSSEQDEDGEISIAKYKLGTPRRGD